MAVKWFAPYGGELWAKLIMNDYVTAYVYPDTQLAVMIKR